MIFIQYAKLLTLYITAIKIDCEDVVSALLKVFLLEFPSQMLRTIMTGSLYNPNLTFVPQGRDTLKDRQLVANPSQTHRHPIAVKLQLISDQSPTNSQPVADWSPTGRRFSWTPTQIARLMGATWGPPGDDVLAIWTLLSGQFLPTSCQPVPN